MTSLSQAISSARFSRKFFPQPAKPVPHIYTRHPQPTREFTQAAREAGFLEWFGGQPPKVISMADIIDAVAEFYRVSPREIVAQGRGGKIVGPRFVAIYLIRELTSFSYPVIGNYFSGRDHSSAVNAVKKIESRMKKNPRLAADVAALRERLMQ